MYATIPSAPLSLVPAQSSQEVLRKNLTAVSRTRVRNGADSWDAVQEAFLHVLEHPPSDTSERSLSAALDAAVRTSCGRKAAQRRDDETLRIALRKRFPV